MIKNYLKVAWRNLRRNKVFSTINIAGLAIGMAVFILMAQFIVSEWNSNRSLSKFERMYRLGITSKDGNQYYIPPGYAPVIKERFPSIEATTRVAEGLGAGVISASQKGKDVINFREESIYYVEGNFLNVFDYPVLNGQRSLQAPGTAAISEKIALKLFGAANVSGQTIEISNQFGKTTYQIASVIKDIPASADIRAEIFLSIHTLESAANRDGNDWADPATMESAFTNIYAVLTPGTQSGLIEKQLTNFAHSTSKSNDDIQCFLQPFKYLHLAPSFTYPYQTYGSLSLVTLLLAIALVIFFIAWINYINLSTVQALKRAKESGVRKVLGASRTQLTFQFLSETFLLTIISTAISLILANVLQPVFNEFTGKELSFSVLNNPWLIGSLILLVIAGATLSGSYVAFILTSVKPASAFKSKPDKMHKGISLRKGLVVFQFSISIIFIIATIVLYNQLQYMKTQKLGISLDQLLVIKGPTVSNDGQAERNFAFKTQLGQLPFIKKYAASNNVPGIGYNFSAEGITRQTPESGDEKKSYKMFISDQNFFDTYGISFVQGRTYTEDEANGGWNQSLRVILNEKAAEQLGFSLKENIIGKKILWGKEYEVIGIVKNYHHLSLRQGIEPAIYLPSVSFGYFTIKTETADMAKKIATLSGMYKKQFPGNPFEYFFADESFNQQYKSEQKLGGIFVGAACVAIFIACMGLFGLAAYSAQQRIKEIGIRKVLGASVPDITRLISKDFLKLVVISIIIASPIAWWSMHKWLQDFAYRTDINVWVFVIAGMSALLIAVVTVSFQAIRAAMTNPAKSLRSE